MATLVAGASQGTLLEPQEERQPTTLEPPPWKATVQFLESLDPAQQTRAALELGHPSRLDWSFFPGRRDGIRLDQLDKDQRAKAMVMIDSILSDDGELTFDRIQRVEKWVNDRGRKDVGKDAFAVAVYGTPGPGSTWAWRLEGHHVTLSLAIVDGRVVSLTPCFFGSDPIVVGDGPDKGLQPLRAEDELARALVRSLDGKQRKLSRLPGKPSENIRSGMSPKIQSVSPAGIAMDQLDRSQQQKLRKLIDTYLGRYEPVLVESYRDGTSPDPAVIRFAWTGSLEDGSHLYYQVTGRNFVIEYANGMGGVTHVHTVWRDRASEFVKLGGSDPDETG